MQAQQHVTHSCSHCVCLCNILATKAEECAVVQLHARNGNHHLYMAHACIDDITNKPQWQCPVVQHFNGAGKEFQANAVKELCRLKLQEGFNLQLCYGYAMLDMHAAHNQINQEDDQARPTHKIDTPIDIVSRFFHLRIEQAAKRLRTCPTILKKICRKHGIDRWPFRHVNAVHRRVRELAQPPQPPPAAPAAGRRRGAA